MNNNINDNDVGNNEFGSNLDEDGNPTVMAGFREEDEEEEREENRKQQQQVFVSKTKTTNTTKTKETTTTTNSHWKASQKVELHRITKAIYEENNDRTDYGSIRKKELFTAVKHAFAKSEGGRKDCNDGNNLSKKYDETEALLKALNSVLRTSIKEDKECPFKDVYGTLPSGTNSEDDARDYCARLYYEQTQGQRKKFSINNFKAVEFAKGEDALFDYWYHENITWKSKSGSGLSITEDADLQAKQQIRAVFGGVKEDDDDDDDDVRITTTTTTTPHNSKAQNTEPALGTFSQRRERGKGAYKQMKRMNEDDDDDPDEEEAREKQRLKKEDDPISKMAETMAGMTGALTGYFKAQTDKQQAKNAALERKTQHDMLQGQIDTLNTLLTTLRANGKVDEEVELTLVRNITILIQKQMAIK